MTLVSVASSSATIDIDDLVSPNPTHDRQLDIDIPDKMRTGDRELSVGAKHPHLVPLWSPANPVTIFEIRPGGKDGPKWEWICPECSALLYQSANHVAAEWGRIEREKGQGRINCAQCRSTKAAERSRVAGLQRGTIASDPVMSALWDEDNPMSPEQVSLKNSDVYAAWKCAAGLHPVFEKRVDHMRTALSEGKSGCPSCVVNGFDKTKPGWIYLISNPDTGMFKVGISNDLERRLKEHGANGFSQHLDLSLEMSGEEAYEREQRMLRYLKRNGVVMGNQVNDAEAHDGWSETWSSGTLMVTQLGQLMRLAREDEAARGIVLDEQ